MKLNYLVCVKSGSVENVISVYEVDKEDAANIAVDKFKQIIKEDNQVFGDRELEPITFTEPFVIPKVFMSDDGYLLFFDGEDWTDGDMCFDTKKGYPIDEDGAYLSGKKSDPELSEYRVRSILFDVFFDKLKLTTTI